MGTWTNSCWTSCGAGAALYLALLLHDVGKGVREQPCMTSLQAAKELLVRLDLDTAEQEAVLF